MIESTQPPIGGVAWHEVGEGGVDPRGGLKEPNPLVVQAGPGPPGATCSTCQRLFVAGEARKTNAGRSTVQRVYWCSRRPPLKVGPTGRASAEHRASWPACALYEPRPEGEQLTPARTVTRPSRYVGTGDVAEMIGATKQAAYHHTKQPGFPAPVADTRRGRVWRRSDVERWWRERQKEDE